MKTPRIRRVLVAVKPFGHSASVAVARARLFAEHTAAEVALLGCVPDVGLGTGIGAGLGTELAWGDPAMLETLERAWAERAREALEELAQPLKYLGKRLTILARAHSPVYEGILEEVASWQADLLVVGVHEPTPLPHTRLTDTDWQLIRLCPCPLLLARDPALARYGTVLAAVDPLPRHGEPPGLDRMILETAHDIADAFAARLCTATAFPESSSPAAAPKTAAGAEDRAAAHRRALDQLIRDTHVTTAATSLRSGNPPQVILDLAGELSADLLVLGALKRSRIRALVLGSTAERVAAEARCDLLLVKPGVATPAPRI